MISIRKIIVMMLLILFAGQMAFASEKTIVLNAEDQFRYARTLFDSRDYISAIVEFTRFIHFFPKNSRVSEARYTIGLAWFKGGKPSEALKIFNDMTESPENTPWQIDAYFMAAQCHEKTGNPVLGEIKLKTLLDLNRDMAIRDRAQNAMGWLRIDCGKWEKARDAFAAISDDGKKTYKVPDILLELDKTPKIPQKNPTLASILSIVPGGGFLYCGRYQDALVSFLLNGGLIAAAAQSFHRKEYALGGVITFVGFGFYAGNIYGSASSANKYNRDADRNYIIHLKQTIQPNVNVGVISTGKKSLGLVVSLDF